MEKLNMHLLKLISLFLILLCFNCTIKPISEVELENQKDIINNNLHYNKDYKTGLCFAHYQLKYNTGVLTNVPCTPEVEKLLGK